MNRTQFAVVLGLLSLPLLVGCAHRGAADPVGRSTTTGAVICPEGYVPSSDGRACVMPSPPSEDREQFDVP